MQHYLQDMFLGKILVILLICSTQARSYGGGAAQASGPRADPADTAQPKGKIFEI